VINFLKNSILYPRNKYQVPSIPETEQTPQVKSLLLLTEKFAVRMQEQDEKITLLKDEIAVLKDEKKRPVFRGSKLDEQTEKSQDDD